MQYFDRLETGGYYLIELDQDHWLISSGSASFNGTFKEVVIWMLTKMGFKASDIDCGIEELIRAQWLHGHNAIHFGMYRNFIFTCKKELGRKAS